MLTKAIVFPLAMMALSAIAAGAHAFEGDWKRALYWACAFGITLSVTL